MGKRKSRKAPPSKKKRVKLSKIFDCPKCQEEGTVSVKMPKSKQENKAIIECKSCHASDSFIVNILSHPVDVFYQWTDKLEEEQQELDEYEDDDDLQDPIDGEIDDVDPEDDDGDEIEEEDEEEGEDDDGDILER